jgi:uncharacterized membrane protein
VTAEPQSRSTRRPIARGGEEFARVLAFSDGLFAIAMTLLVVGIAVPTLSSPGDEGQLWSALRDIDSAFVSFFISFAVIGRYWIAHHQFFRLLREMDYGLIWLNMAYLAFVAFLPFPTAVLGTYFENPVSIVVYAVAIAVVSGLEVVMLRHAYRHRLIEREIPEDVYRWGVLLSTVPIVFFLGSIPFAFLSSTLAVLIWFGSVPADLLLGRWKPPHADEYFE